MLLARHLVENLEHRECEGEDWGIGILTYAEGTQAVVEGNYLTTGGMEDVVEIYGTEGVVKVDLTFGSPLHVYSRKGYGYAMEKADFTHGWTPTRVIATAYHLCHVCLGICRNHIPNNTLCRTKLHTYAFGWFRSIGMKMA